MDEPRQIILYTKPVVTLRREKSEIAKAHCADLYQMTEINIETDPALASYTNTIFPLLIDGVEAFRHRLTSDSFRACLQGEGA